MKNVLRFFYLATFSLLCFLATGQTMIPLPIHGSVYTGNVRGYWFTAPNNFIITGLRVPTSAGTASQYIQLVKFTSAGPPSYSSSTTAYTTLTFIQHAPNGYINPVSIPIAAGDIIGILGQDSLNHNSYATPTGTYSSTINGASVTLTRMLYQGQLRNGMAGAISQEISAAIARVEIYYTPPASAPDDAGVLSVDSPTSNCAGVYNAVATIKNFGTNRINSVIVNWKYNGVTQSPVVYTGLLDTANGTGSQTAQITLGTVLLPGGTSRSIKAWTTLPNNKSDTVNYNDTASESFSGYNYPVINFGANKTICPNDPLKLKVNVLHDSIRWSNSSTFDSLMVNSAGTYSVKVYKNGCMGGDTINISMYPSPPSVNLGNDTTICTNQGILLNATNSGVTYLWQDSTTTATKNVSTAGTYWVILEDANSCKSGDTIVVKTYKDPTISLAVSPKSSICFGIPYTFTATAKTDGSILYQWKVNGINTGTPTTSNTFTGPVEFGDSVSVDLITDICASAPYPVPSNKIAMFINPAAKQINGIPVEDTVIEFTTKNYAIGITSGNSYIWRISGGTIQGDTTLSAVQVVWDGPNPNAFISVEEKDNNNCKRDNILPVRVISIVGLDEKNNIGIGDAYPNPANTMFTLPVYSNSPADISLNLYDVSGILVKTVHSKNLTGKTNLTVNIDDLSNGMYFYKVTSSEGYSVMKKINIQH